MSDICIQCARNDIKFVIFQVYQIRLYGSYRVTKVRPGNRHKHRSTRRRKVTELFLRVRGVPATQEILPLMMSHSPALHVEVGKYSMSTLMIDLCFRSKWHKFLWGQLFLFCLIGQHMKLTHMPKSFLNSLSTG